LAVLDADIRGLSDSQPGQVLSPKRIAAGEIAVIGAFFVVVAALWHFGRLDREQKQPPAKPAEVWGEIVGNRPDNAGSTNPNFGPKFKNAVLDFIEEAETACRLLETRSSFSSYANRLHAAEEAFARIPLPSGKQDIYEGGEEQGVYQSSKNMLEGLTWIGECLQKRSEAMKLGARGDELAEELLAMAQKAATEGLDHLTKFRGVVLGSSSPASGTSAEHADAMRDTGSESKSTANRVAADIPQTSPPKRIDMDGLLGGLCCLAAGISIVAIITTGIMAKSRAEAKKRAEILGLLRSSLPAGSTVTDEHIGVDLETAIGLDRNGGSFVLWQKQTNRVQVYPVAAIRTIEYCEDGEVMSFGLGVPIAGIGVGGASSNKWVKTIQLRLELTDVNNPYVTISFLDKTPYPSVGVPKERPGYLVPSRAAREWKARLEAMPRAE
jgi:hypothetical protein